MGKLIYVFSDEDRKRLLGMGYVMMSEDAKNHIYAFREGDKAKFASLAGSEIKYCVSDKLTL